MIKKYALFGTFMYSLISHSAVYALDDEDSSSGGKRSRWQADLSSGSDSETNKPPLKRLKRSEAVSLRETQPPVPLHSVVLEVRKPVATRIVIPPSGPGRPQGKRPTLSLVIPPEEAADASYSAPSAPYGTQQYTTDWTEALVVETPTSASLLAAVAQIKLKTKETLDPGSEE